MILESILLGLSTGTYCAMYCGPVLIPFLSGSESQSFRRNALLTGAFLLGRLLMYFALGAVLGSAGLLVSEFFDPVLARKLSVFAYIFCGATLLLNSLAVRFPWSSKDKGGCRCARLRPVANDWATAAIAGLSVGLHICPPLWTAIVRSIFGGYGIKGFLYLVFFYVGSIPFFIPLLGIPFLIKAVPVLKRIARIAQFLTAVYFVAFNGLIELFF